MKNISTTIKNYERLLKRLLSSESYLIRDLDIDKKQHKPKHNVEGVYIILDKKDTIIYVGKTISKTILDRVGSQHVYGGSSSDLRDIIGRPKIDEIFKYKCKYIEIKNRKERSMFEYFVISILKPKFNK